MPITSAPFFRAALALLLVLGLASCNSESRSTSFSATAEEGLVIISVIERQNSGIVWFGGSAAFARYNPQTLEVTGSSGIRSGIITQGFTFTNTLISAKERFRAYKLQPGEYALLSITSINDPQSTKVTTLVDRDPFKVRDNTPVFSVKAGEVLYLGELEIDLRPFPASVKIGTNPQGLSEFLKSMPNVTVDKVVVRPLISRSRMINKPA